MVTGADKNPPSREEFDQLVARTHRNEPGAREDLVQLLNRHPQIWRSIGDSGKHVELLLVKLITGGDTLLVESFQRQQRCLKRRLLGKSTCPLERLAVERILVARLELAYAELLAVEYQQGEKVNLPTANFLQRQKAQAQRYYDQAIRGLMDLRRLLPAKNQATRDASDKPSHHSTYKWDLPEAIRNRMYGTTPRTEAAVSDN